MTKQAVGSVLCWTMEVSWLLKAVAIHWSCHGGGDILVVRYFWAFSREAEEKELEEGGVLFVSIRFDFVYTLCRMDFNLSFVICWKRARIYMVV